MTEMPPKLKELQRRLGESDFRFVSAGDRQLSDEVYPAVEQQFPRLCDESIECTDVCSAGSRSPEWQHRVRTALHRLADESDSRVEKSNEHGYWKFE